MSENEEMSMAQKLEVLRQVTSYGVGSGYEPNGERGPVVIEVPEFEPARSTITEIHSGSPVSSAEFDEPIMTPSAGGGGDHMWKLTVALDGTIWKYEVALGTIRDRTNGPMLDLGAIFDVKDAVPVGVRYVSLKGTVTPATLEIPTWALALSEDEPKEIVFETDVEETQGQIALNFLIGKITIGGDPATATVEQIATLPQRIVMVFLNGEICKGITSV